MAVVVLERMCIGLMRVDDVVVVLLWCDVSLAFESCYRKPSRSETGVHVFHTMFYVGMVKQQ